MTQSLHGKFHLSLVSDINNKNLKNERVFWKNHLSKNLVKYSLMIVLQDLNPSTHLHANFDIGYQERNNALVP